MSLAEARAAATPDTPAPTPAPAVRFTGDTRAYWRLQLRGALLLAVTLGIYRFWFATDVRRFLWANTEVAGEPLEYTGTPTELLVGFLIAIAILVPLNLVIAIAALGAGDLGALVSILALLLLFFLGQFAIYRARRYRLTRTVYRGVRCHQDGSALRYAVCAVFWWSLIVLTLGLAYPFAQSRLERFKLRHTYFGDLKGAFEGSGVRLFLRGLPMWCLVIGPLLGAAAYTALEVQWPAIIAAASIASSIGEFLNAIEDLPTNLHTAIILCVSAAVFSVLAAAVLFPVFQAMVLRWWIGGLRLGKPDDRFATAHRADLPGVSSVSRLWAAVRRGDGGDRRARRGTVGVRRRRPQQRRCRRGCQRAHRHRPLCHHHARFLGDLSGDGEAHALARRHGIDRVRRRGRARAGQSGRRGKLRGRRRPRRCAQHGRYLMGGI